MFTERRDLKVLTISFPWTSTPSVVSIVGSPHTRRERNCFRRFHHLEGTQFSTFENVSQNLALLKHTNFFIFEKNSTEGFCALMAIEVRSCVCHRAKASFRKINLRVFPSLCVFFSCILLKNVSLNLIFQFFSHSCALRFSLPKYENSLFCCSCHNRKLKVVLGQHAEVRIDRFRGLEDEETSRPLGFGFISFKMISDDLFGMRLEPARCWC